MSSSSFNVPVVASAMTEVTWGLQTKSMRPVLKNHQIRKLGSNKRPWICHPQTPWPSRSKITGFGEVLRCSSGNSNPKSVWGCSGMNNQTTSKCSSGWWGGGAREEDLVLKSVILGTSLEAQWLTLPSSTAGSMSSILVGELRSQRPHGKKKKKHKTSNILTNSINFFNGPHQKKNLKKNTICHFKICKHSRFSSRNYTKFVAVFKFVLLWF